MWPECGAKPFRTTLSRRSLARDKTDAKQLESIPSRFRIRFQVEDEEPRLWELCSRFQMSEIQANM